MIADRGWTGRIRGQADRIVDAEARRPLVREVSRCDGPKRGREVLVLKGYDEVAVFLGLDVGKQGHHAVAQDPSGKKLLDRVLPNDEAKLRESASCTAA